MSATDPQANSYVDEYTPPAANAQVSSQQDDQPQDQQPKVQEEDLEAQNIFMMLAAEEGSSELKEKFLDQLQEVIWDDFLTSDVELLITNEENVEFAKLNSAVEDATDPKIKEQAKDKLVGYLEKLIPDLEEIMLEKALDLKADLFVERISGMKEYFADNQEKLNRVLEAESLMFEDKWLSATKILNEIQE